jgi:DNA ligase (NAD+)
MNIINNRIIKMDYKIMTKSEIVKLLINSDNAYYNLGTPTLTDFEYDEIKDYLKTIDKKNSYFKNIGADVIGDNKVKLPFFLGSQDKIKDDDKTLQKWLKKYNKPTSYIISEKLDGISCLITNDNNTIHIYTRGNGIYGQDITHLKKYIKGLPDFHDKKYAVRGELIISKSNWLTIADKGSNARNVVAGVINSKTVDKLIASLIDFIVYDVLNPRTNIQTALNYAKNMKFNTVSYIISTELNIPFLYNKFREWKEQSLYEIDGLVITHNDIYKLKTGENPKYSFAFKSLQMQQQIEVIVNDIEWNVSKDKYLKPIIKFNEIKLNGVKIKQATGFNADYIVSNIIGIGSKLIIIRSGDVIPYIKEIISIASNGKPLLPTIPFIWKGKDIMIEGNIKNREQDIKIFTNFMKTLNIKGIGEGIITKLYDNSFDTLYKIINITKNELISIDGFKDKSATNLIESLKSIRTAKCIDLMHASNIMGRGLGEKKLQLVIDTYPFICSDQIKALKLTIEDLKKINGLGDISAALIISNLKLFFDFYNTLSIDTKDTKDIKDIKDTKDIKDIKDIKDTINLNDKYKDKIYVFTGIRDKNLENIIILNGGKIADNITNKTTALIVKNITDATVKVKKAKLLNIPIIIYDDFIK